MSSRKKQLGHVRTVCIATTLGISILSVQGLILDSEMHKSFAMGLAVFALIAITFMVSLAVKIDEA